MRSRLKAHLSLGQMSTTLEDLVETAIMLDYNERDVVGSWCRHPKYAKKIRINIRISGVRHTQSYAEMTLLIIDSSSGSYASISPTDTLGGLPSKAGRGAWT